MARVRWREKARVGLAVLVVALVAAGATGAVIASADSGRPAAAGRQPITLVFAGQDVGNGLEPFIDPYPPIEGGDATVYTVPATMRLVIESLYADVYERWNEPTLEQPGTSPRTGFSTGISTAYPVEAGCEFPGYERDYGIEMTDPVGDVSDGTHELRRSGMVSGPIFVEGGREVAGVVTAPGGDSTVYVKIVAHGYLEPATNPAPPTFHCS